LENELQEARHRITQEVVVERDSVRIVVAGISGRLATVDKPESTHPSEIEIWGLSPVTDRTPNLPENGSTGISAMLWYDSKK
jgi:hypothetical protein